jgi:flavin reductase (DIM6/NTAB) family NADH-FMN oxidoreductase RutF
MSDKVKLKPSISHFYTWPLVLATCSDEQDRPNIITLAASSPCSFDPPTIGIAIAHPRYSHQLIAERGEFGVNVPTHADLARSDLCGSISGREGDKFAAVGFTPMPADEISVPLIAECPINFECRTVHTANLGSHDRFIGEILAVHASPEVLADGDRVDPEKLDGVLCYWMQYLRPGPTVAGWGYARKEDL